MYMNEILPKHWHAGQWPDYIEVSHVTSRFKTRRYIPCVDAHNASSSNPVDGIWCSRCGWAGRVERDLTDTELHREPQFDELGEEMPRYCPNCGAILIY